MNNILKYEIFHQGSTKNTYAPVITAPKNVSKISDNIYPSDVF
jgi:hypothetical protein